MALAEAIRGQRLVEFQNKRFGFAAAASDILLLPYFAAKIKETESRKAASTTSVHESVLSHLVNYAHPKTLLREVDRAWIDGFRAYLCRRKASKKDKPLASSSVHAYLSIFITLLRQAYKDRILDRLPVYERGTAETSERTYLSLDEIKKIAATECTSEVVKRAFLFSCLTGLRRSDILALSWGDIQQHGDFTRIIFRQRKTRQLEYYDISPSALQYVGERGEDKEKVFCRLSAETIRYHLSKWVRSAGISKRITFHAARHSFAVLMIEIGADIYTISKLLGHSSVKTTQIYAHMIDKRKQEAVSLIPSLD